MRGLVGSLLLGGAALEGIAQFVPSNGFKIWLYTHSSFRGFVGTAHYTLPALALAAVAVAIFATGSRQVAAFAAGIAVVSAVAWLQLAIQRWIGGYGHVVYWNGFIGLVGAIIASVGAVIGWSVGFDRPAGRVPVSGWYSDPSGTGQRWWDGTTWTSHTTP